MKAKFPTGVVDDTFGYPDAATPGFSVSGLAGPTCYPKIPKLWKWPDGWGMPNYDKPEDPSGGVIFKTAYLILVKSGATGSSDDPHSAPLDIRLNGTTIFSGTIPAENSFITWPILIVLSTSTSAANGFDASVYPYVAQAKITKSFSKDLASPGSESEIVWATKWVPWHTPGHPTSGVGWATGIVYMFRATKAGKSPWQYEDIGTQLIDFSPPYPYPADPVQAFNVTFE